MEKKFRKKTRNIGPGGIRTGALSLELAELNLWTVVAFVFW